MLGAYTALLIFAGGGALLLALMNMQEAEGLGSIFVLGLILFGWVANLMATR